MPSDSYSLNIILRVSFSPDRDRACFHCWISSFITPWENGCNSFTIFYHGKKSTLDNTYSKKEQYLKNIWNNLDLGDLRVKFVNFDGRHPFCMFFDFHEKHDTGGEDGGDHIIVYINIYIYIYIYFIAYVYIF